MRHDRLKDLRVRYCYTAGCNLGPLLMLIVVTCFVDYLIPCTVDTRPGEGPPHGCAASKASNPINLIYYSAARPRPRHGLPTGRSRMPTKAPMLWLSPRDRDVVDRRGIGAIARVAAVGRLEEAVSAIEMLDAPDPA